MKRFLTLMLICLLIVSTLLLTSCDELDGILDELETWEGIGGGNREDEKQENVKETDGERTDRDDTAATENETVTETENEDVIEDDGEADNAYSADHPAMNDQMPAGETVATLNGRTPAEVLEDLLLLLEAAPRYDVAQTLSARVESGTSVYESVATETLRVGTDCAFVHREQTDRVMKLWFVNGDLYRETNEEKTLLADASFEAFCEEYAEPFFKDLELDELSLSDATLVRQGGDYVLSIPMTDEGAREYAEEMEHGSDTASGTHRLVLDGSGSIKLYGILFQCGYISERTGLPMKVSTKQIAAFASINRAVTVEAPANAHEFEALGNETEEARLWGDLDGDGAINDFDRYLWEVTGYDDRNEDGVTDLADVYLTGITRQDWSLLVARYRSMYENEDPSHNSGAIPGRPGENEENTTAIPETPENEVEDGNRNDPPVIEDVTVTEPSEETTMRDPVDPEVTEAPDPVPPTATTPSINLPAGSYGDMDGDGAVDTFDAFLVQEVDVADINSDGKVDREDVRLSGMNDQVWAQTVQQYRNLYMAAFGPQYSTHG